MSLSVFTGGRTVRLSSCHECGADDGWQCAGYDTIYCSCQTCPECETFDGHTIKCTALDEEDE